MEMLLMIGCISLFGLAVTCLAFGAATGASEPPVSTNLHEPAAVAPARFFADAVATMPPAAPAVPLAALLLQIESHVRLEQAAAESFLEAPTAALLHSRTMSPFVN
jgi:hypothetical protein